jgi:Oxidoreductase family, NAD-binding Rossmann fold
MISAVPEQSSRPLRVAIIGAGLMGYWHSKTARHLGSQVVAVVDPDANRAREVARACGAAATGTDATQLLQRGDLDAVHICTPAQTHGALAAQSLEAGINVLIEKPLAPSADETRRLIGIAERKSVILCPVHQVAFQTATDEAAKALAGLGTPCAIDFRILSDGGTGHNESELDDIVGDILPHPFSVLRRLWPQADWEPNRWSVSHPRAGELLIGGEYAGALLSLLVSLHARPTRFEMLLHGCSHAMALDFFHGLAIRYDGNVSRLRKIVRPFSTSLKLFCAASMNLIERGLRAETAYPGLRQLTQKFYTAVRGGGPPPISAEDVMAVAVARDAIRTRFKPGF